MDNSQTPKIDIDHIAKLSRLELKPEEGFIKDQLYQAAEYIQIINEVNTNNVIPTFQVNHKRNVVRSDIVTPSLSQKEALSQAKKVQNGYFVTSLTIQK